VARIFRRHQLDPARRSGDLHGGGAGHHLARHRPGLVPGLRARTRRGSGRGGHAVAGPALRRGAAARRAAAATSGARRRGVASTDR
jgi:hypothetical protein